MSPEASLRLGTHFSSALINPATSAHRASRPHKPDVVMSPQKKGGLPITPAPLTGLNAFPKGNRDRLVYRSELFCRHRYQAVDP